MTKMELVQAKADEFQLGMVDLLKGKLGDAYDAGVASVVEPVPADTQALIDAAVAAKEAEMHAQLDSKQAELDKALSDDASDKAKISEAQKVIDGIRAILSPPVPAPTPVEPAPTPVEEPAPTPAPVDPSVTP